jgi:hypothetical protein
VITKALETFPAHIASSVGTVSHRQTITKALKSLLKKHGRALFSHKQAITKTLETCFHPRFGVSRPDLTQAADHDDLRDAAIRTISSHRQAITKALEIRRDQAVSRGHYQLTQADDHEGPRDLKHQPVPRDG